MHVDWDFLKFVFEVVGSLCGAFAAFALLFLNSRYKPRVEMMLDEEKSKTEAANAASKITEQLKGVSERLNRHDARIVVCEQSLVHAPTKEDIAKLALMVGGVAKELAELRGEQKAQNNLLGTIHHHLLSGQGGA